MKTGGQREAGPMREAEPMAAEQAADFAALQAAANDAPPAPGQPQAAPEVEPRERIAQELAGLVLAFVGIAKPILPSLAEIYTPEATSTAAQAVAAVCVKHGWLADGLMGEWGEEIAAAAVLLPLGFATYQGVTADLAKGKAKERPGQVAAPADAPSGPRSVTVGTVIAEPAE